MSDVREVIARALRQMDACPDVEGQVAVGLLSALREAGHAVVPVEPTPAMLDAWDRAVFSSAVAVGRKDSGLRQKTWRAMIEAARGAGGEDV